MAASIFTILDDIAILADDIAVATKVSVTKTAGILGDDIAVGAKQATGFKESRELQVIYKILKGSLINKTIILPMAFIISLIYPPLITIILIFGGFYLAYEGFEGLLNLKSLFSKSKNKDKESNGVEEEDKKIKAAIKTDFILSIEIIILAMSTVVSEPIIIQLVTTSVVALLASIGVYGLVAMIVRLDDFGFLLIEKKYNKTGLFFIRLLPIIIKILSIVGVFAMLVVAGGIFNHNISFIHIQNDNFVVIKELFLGVIVGLIIYLIENIIHKIKEIIK